MSEDDLEHLAPESGKAPADEFGHLAAALEDGRLLGGADGT